VSFGPLKPTVLSARAGLALVGATLASASLLSAGALAAQAKPLGITTFSMQTTRAVPVPDGPGLPGYGFVNEPYSFTQAGGHPDALTSKIELETEEVGKDHSIVATRDLRDLTIGLPPGLLADPLAVSRCPHSLATSGESCPLDSQVGVFVLRSAKTTMLGPIVDLIPEAGQVAELGLETPYKIAFPLVGHVVRTPAGYGLALVAGGLPRLAITGVETTLWGDPAAAVNDPLRGLVCTTGDVEQQWSCEGGGAKSGEAPAPFLTMPSDCSAGPQVGSVWADSWEEPGQYARAQSTLPAMSGCEQLPFGPEMEVSPDTLLADEPVGVDVRIKAAHSEEQEVATPPLRSAHVSLAQGLSISPGAAGGLQACGRDGPEGIDIPTGLNANGQTLEPGEMGEGEELGLDGEAQLAPGHCPRASTVGEVEAFTPLVGSPIKGHVYLASPGCGGPLQASCGAADAADGNLYRLYLELGGEPGEEGVDVKVEAEIQANPATGQLTLTLTESPQLALSELRIELTGGPRALLDSPATCGTSTTTSDLEAWSAPGTTPAPESQLVPGTANADPSSFYDVSGCSNTPALHPGFLAGTLTPRAGAFSAFTFSVTRGDREPYLSQIQLRTPPGLSAMLASVPLCDQALANAGSCPQASQIGSTVIASGAGSDPLEMPGRIYLTSGYDGAPFGLSIVTEARAGPLNLGVVVIRARVDVDPETATIAITSDPLPQIVLGVPLRLQKVTLDIDRPRFMLNPTNCGPLQVTATIVGTSQTSAAVSNPFAVGGCKSLAFKPELKASTSGHTSYAGGASLEIKLTLANAEQGGEANLAQVKVALPKQLPSRLTTLQGACPRVTFDANPAACPRTSVVGIARARTPVLTGELMGPVYFVSRGRNAFPAPVMLLQGEGVTLELSGSTLIEKTGLASIVFNGLPDVPIESLELYLPRGAHSMLAANANLCRLSRTVTVRRKLAEHVRGQLVHRIIEMHKRVRASLLMPTELVAQNGAIVHQNTKIEVSGCPAR
jgi:hypothetical protein